MSNLGNLMQNGGVVTAEPQQFESMTESDQSALLYIAMLEAAEEEVEDETVSTESATIMEGVMPEDHAVVEASIVRLDKKAKRQRAYKLAILQCAKEDDNKDYKKLETLWRMEKFLFRKLEKRYAARARSRMTQTAKKAGDKEGGVLAKAKRVLTRGGKTRSQRETEKALAGQTKPPAQIKQQTTSIMQKLGNKI